MAPAARLTRSLEAEVPARPSPGCRPGTPVPSQGSRTLTSGGLTRRFNLRLADGKSAPSPLVLNFHGLLESPAQQELLSGMDEKAARRGMVLVYPQGVGTSWNGGSCCGRAQEEQVDDVRFVRDLVRELGNELCLDLNRVYATGMSNGGILSYRLACEASDLIAAIAPVAAVELLPACAPRRPVPVLAFNGTSDPLVSYAGGRFGFPSVEETQARWALRNRCAPGAARRTAWDRGQARCEAAVGCAADVVFCKLEGGGHTWPGGLRAPFLGRTSEDLDASETLLDFFLDHPLR